MSFPPLHPASQNSIASGASNPSSAGSARPRQSAWGLSAQPAGTRRGLTPLSTNVPSTSLESSARRPGSSSSTSVQNTTASPFTSTFSSVLNSTSRLGNSRTTSSASSSTSPFAPLQTGSQQLHTSQPLSSPRSRATTPFSTSNLASSAAASIIVSQGGGGGGGSTGGGGTSRPAAFSPSLSNNSLSSPTATTFDRNAFVSSVTTPTNTSQSVSKIVVTQVFLLLGSITEKEGEAKWDSQAEAIRKLVDSHGMEVFAKFFRRLIVGNSPQIFPGINRNVENPGNHQLLVEEIEKASQDPEQAKKIAEIIDTSEGDTFRDFDLATFLNHFNLDPVGKTILASAFTQVTRQDLRTKAASILVTHFPATLQSFANPHNNEHNTSPQLLATAAFHLLRDLPESSRDGSEKNRVYLTLQSRYATQDLPVPPVIRSAMALTELFEGRCDLAKELQRQGPQALANLDAIKEFLGRYGKDNVNESQVANALLFMILTPDSAQYWPDRLVTAVREQVGGILDWQKLIRQFDRKGLFITREQFLALYNALLPIAKDNPDFDIQGLWGGEWDNAPTQLSFALGLASLTPDQLDARTIPGLRKSYDATELSDGTDEVVQFIEEALRDTMISIDAVIAISEILFNNEDPPAPEDSANAKHLISAKMSTYLCSAAGIPKPWSAALQNLMARLLIPYLLGGQPNHQFVLHCLWKQDKHWLATELIKAHQEDPIKLPMLLEHAREHGWIEDLCTMMNGFGIDLAALAHRKGYINIEQWADDKLTRSPDEFVMAVPKFLVIKAQDEMRTVRGEQPAPRTVSLAMKTVHALLLILEEVTKERRGDLIALERQCMQAFPRLINYGEGFDDVIEANGEETNILSQTTDAEMQDLYKRMYSAELEVRDIIEALRECKTSKDPARQDLFSCMIHGLFDEYVCFNEYPLGPLATTAVLFGGIISYGLISNLTLNVGLEMVLEAVRDYSTETSMYKFGLQALIHFLNRLPEWPDFCQQLIQIRGLEGTEAYACAQDVIRDGKISSSNLVNKNDLNGTAEEPGLTNGNIEEFLASDSVGHKFQSIYAEPLVHTELYQDPEEDVQDKVLFVLNNVSEQNLSTKVQDLVGALEPKHHHWFASYLVEQRAKLQPNYQQLYLDMLGLLGEKNLWSEVLRETYVCVKKIMNAESTMKSTMERTYMKNLAKWLGSLTIARDKPIKHKNIAFKELLLEGWETQRLVLVIPFTCVILGEGVKSVVFKPPNPWVMEIISLLLELYDLPELKIQQKFDIERLLVDFGFPQKGKNMERSNELQKRQQMFEEENMSGSMLPDGLDGFDDLAIGGFQKGIRNARLTPTTLASSLPDLENLLVFPPPSGSPAHQARLRQIVQNAVQRAILEIIGPVVERSVTIATIATRDLIHKDYAQEPDEERVREASQQMAKALSGSLALVTSKEPLRMSMTNYIRLAANEIQDQAFPEGSILMCVNDNLDTACSLVEKQAEDRSLPEIDIHIDNEIARRRQHKVEFPNEPYRDAVASHWSSYIPEPYKQNPGGLNQEQLDIYLQFARQSRGVANHVQTSSTDSGKQIPDVLQEAGFPSIPNLPTPAEPPAVPLQPNQQQRQLQGQMLPPTLPASRAQPQVNGYGEATSIQEHIQDLLTRITQFAAENGNKQYKELNREDPIVEIVNRIHTLILSALPNHDAVAWHTASAVCSSLSVGPATRLEIEALVQILQRACQLSINTAKEVLLLFRNQDEEKILAVNVTAALLEAQLMEFGHVDLILAKGIHQQKPEPLLCLSNLLDLLLFVPYPVALRADFASSLGAMGDWLFQESDLAIAQSIMSKLRDAGLPESVDIGSDEPSFLKQHQMQYIFQEWITLFSHPDPTDGMYVAFITQLHNRQILNSQEEMVLFLRLCIETSVDVFEEPIAIDDLGDPYAYIDALARMIVLLVKNQGENPGAVKGSKSSYMDSILSLIVLILNNHHVIRGEQFSQRVFYRLLSSILYDWHDFSRGASTLQDKEMVQVFANNFLLLEPQCFPAFVYGWLSLISHRIFMPAILKSNDEEGREPFTKIMEVMLSYVSELLRQPVITGMAKELYRGALRILLILHHDFPEFLAENHYRLCNQIPASCTQLRNLVLSAYPSSILELPDPFASGLKVDRLEEIRKAPMIAGDILIPLRRGNVKEVIDDCLRSTEISDENINILYDVIETGPSHSPVSESSPSPDSTLLHAIVLYIGQTAISATGVKTGSSFNSDSPQARLLRELAKNLHPEARYCFLSAIVNQLRYPNSHTHFFSYALLHLFGNDLADQQESDVRQQITRVLLERLVVHRPHPWGLIITLLELLKNPTYMFWDLPFIKAAPEVEKLFSALFQHINQTRTLL